MKLGRRAFLRALGIALGAIATGGAIRSLRMSSADELQSLAEATLDHAKRLGCSYADVRIDRFVRRDMRGVNERCAVRVIDQGAWGVAICASLERSEISRTVSHAIAAARAHAALATDPFALERPVSLVADDGRRVEEMYFASSKGARSWTMRRFA